MFLVVVYFLQRTQLTLTNYPRLPSGSRLTLIVMLFDPYKMK